MNTIQPATSPNTIRITAVNSVEQARRVDEAIARRAYEIFEGRGGLGWHEPQDWRTAESEVRSTMCFGLTSSEDSLLVSCNIGGFEKGAVEIGVAPRQITICGKPVGDEKQLPIEHSYRAVVFRIVALPVEIKPLRVFTKTKQNFLEIHLPMVHTEQREHIAARAA